MGNPNHLEWHLPFRPAWRLFTLRKRARKHRCPSIATWTVPFWGCRLRSRCDDLLDTLAAGQAYAIIAFLKCWYLIAKHAGIRTWEIWRDAWIEHLISYHIVFLMDLHGISDCVVFLHGLSVEAIRKDFVKRSTKRTKWILCLEITIISRDVT